MGSGSTVIKYHGTPITPRTVLHDLAGKNFCVSFAAPGDVAWCDEHAQMLMLDNGAFSFWRQGVLTDWPGYYRWCERWLERNTTWAVIPDVIDGSVEENDRLVAEWPFGVRGAPVWHLHEPFDRLLGLCDGWPLVCVGSSGRYAEVGSPSWHARVGGAFDLLVGREARLHMLRGLMFADGPYPFFSADSTNVARNHAGTNGSRARQSPRRMADDIDGRNPARRWVPTFEQLNLAGVEVP